MKRWLLCVASTLLAVAGSAPGAAGTVRHLLWDADQRPLYQRCARDFEAANPGVRIRIQQQGWDDYWMTLSTGFISGTAPDVFTNHVSKFAEFVANGVVADLAPLAARDRVALDDYEPGLLAPWQLQQRLYALPADWDTVALLVNVPVLRAAGLTVADVAQADWNPRDGGRFGRLIERLTQDENGRRADEPGFDARRVRVRGYQVAGPGGMMGQTEWSHFAVSAGWRYQDRPWDPALRYDDPLLIDTLDWLAGLNRRGLSATPQALGKLGADSLFAMGRVALLPTGSWMVGNVARHVRFEHAWVPLPVGPTGRRASMRNGLAHSLWSGSRNAGEAWAWLRFLGSRACQAQVAEAGVVYPAVKGLAEVALAAQRRQGEDARAFIEMAAAFTYAAPLAPHAAEVTDRVGSAIERVLAGRVPAAQVMPEVARQVRAISAQP